jgi:hypothetical protein
MTLLAFALLLVIGRAALADNSKDRATALYFDEYVPSEGVPSEWNGDIAAGNAGTVSPRYTAAILRRINYYRAMAGLPGAITFRHDWNLKCA